MEWIWIRGAPRLVLLQLLHKKSRFAELIQDFRYLTPKVRLDQNSLSHQLLHAQAFHLVCSAERCMSLVRGVLDRRRTDENDKRSTFSRPLFIWEPIPDLCTPENIESFRQASQHVDIVSPNSEELAGFFVDQSKSQAQMTAQVLEWGIGPDENGSIVVREGKNGCSAFSRRHQIHLTAYYTPADESQSKVKDPTGGGNAFMGALGMAFSRDICPPIAEAKRLLAIDANLTFEPFLALALPLIYATVAASFVIEQPGMPTYRVQNDGSETWNGEDFGDRLKVYLSREKAHLARQMKR
jgi:sugar/nucleoside kinase (ribokinase family)